MTRIVKGMFLFVLAGALVLGTGCSNDDDDNSNSNTSTNPTGTYEGTWTGKVCGRNLTMKVAQSGNNLSGTYTLSDPTFTEKFSGKVNNTIPPASADLIGGGDRMFAINFKSYNSFSGGYFKSGSKVCDVNATK